MRNEQEPAKPGPRFHAIPRHIPWGLLFVLLTALALRLYRLDAQSVTGDEGMAIFMQSNSLLGYLRLAFAYSIERIPICHVLDYTWCCIFGFHHNSLRLYEITLNLCTLAVIYALGKELSSKKVALFACLLMAISPFHIFYAQNITVYSLLALAGSASVFTLVKAMKTSSPRWWFANAAINLAMFWVHLGGVYLLVAEGMILLAWRLPLRTTFRWSIIHMILLMPNVYLAFSAHAPTPPGFYDLFAPASLENLARDVIGDDVINLNDELIPGCPLDSPFASHYGSMCTAADVLGKGLAAINVLCVFAGLAYVTLAGLRARRNTLRGHQRRNALTIAVPLLVATAPVVTLAVSSHVLMPYFFPRYTIYTAPGIYLLTAVMLASLPRRLFPGCAFAVIILYLSQTLLLVTSTVRADWKSIARELSRKATADDLILLGGGTFYRLYFENYGRKDIPLLNLPFELNNSGVPAAAIADAYLRQTMQAPGAPSPSVWLTYAATFDDQPLSLLQQELTARGLSYEYTFYPGGEHIKCYRITRGPLAQSLPPAPSGIGEIEQLLASLTEQQLRATARTLLNHQHENNMLIGTLTPLFAQAANVDVLRRQCARIERARLWRYTGTFFRPFPETQAQQVCAGLLEHNGLATTDDNCIRYFITKTFPAVHLESFEDFRTLLRDNALPNPVPSEPRQALINAVYLAAEGDITAAAATLNQAAVNFPTDSQIRLARATIETARGNHDQAAILLNETAEAMPELRPVTEYMLQLRDGRQNSPMPPLLLNLISLTGAPLAPPWLAPCSQSPDHSVSH